MRVACPWTSNKCRNIPVSAHEETKAEVEDMHEDVSLSLKDFSMLKRCKACILLLILWLLGAFRNNNFFKNVCPQTSVSHFSHSPRLNTLSWRWDHVSWTWFLKHTGHRLCCYLVEPTVSLSAYFGCDPTTSLTFLFAWGIKMQCGHCWLCHIIRYMVHLHPQSLCIFFFTEGQENKANQAVA